jgi:hypothetical protein
MYLYMKKRVEKVTKTAFTPKVTTGRLASSGLYVSHTSFKKNTREEVIRKGAKDFAKRFEKVMKDLANG